MNRAVEYRGSDIRYGQWVYGSLVGFGDRFFILDTKLHSRHCQPEDISFGNRSSEVLPETVGLCSNKVDQDQAEIYEGDFIDSKDATFNLADEGEIVWRRHKFMVKHWVPKQKRLCIGRTMEVIPGRFQYQDLCEFDSKKIKVIGNTVDNPDFWRDEVDG